jgi:hypothetical protein
MKDNKIKTEAEKNLEAHEFIYCHEGGYYFSENEQYNFSRNTNYKRDGDIESWEFQDGSKIYKTAGRFTVEEIPKPSKTWGIPTFKGMEKTQAYGALCTECFKQEDDNLFTALHCNVYWFPPYIKQYEREGSIEVWLCEDMSIIEKHGRLFYVRELGEGLRWVQA